MEPNLTRNIKATDELRELALQMGVKTSSLAIAWLLHRGEHILPIPGTRSVEHLKELAAGTDLKLKTEELEAINNILPLGWAHGDRYSPPQWIAPERYC